MKRIFLIPFLLVAGIASIAQGNPGQASPPVSLVQFRQLDNLRVTPTQTTTEDPKLQAQASRAEEQRQEQIRQTAAKLEQETKDALAVKEKQRIADEAAEKARQAEAAKPKIAISYSGNSYTAGQCTWYVASRRSVPSSWGNAVNWLASARSSGFATGSVPKVGAIAWTGIGWAGHVAIVEAVTDAGVTISEMNGSAGPFNVDQRLAAPGEFQYIY